MSEKTEQLDKPQPKANLVRPDLNLVDISRADSSLVFTPSSGSVSDSPGTPTGSRTATDRFESPTESSRQFLKFTNPFSEVNDASVVKRANDGSIATSTDGASSRHTVEDQLKFLADIEKYRATGFKRPGKVPANQQFASFDVIGDTKNVDPRRPTVAVLDNFIGMGAVPNGYDNGQISHGTLSAYSARERGFNVLPLQITERYTKHDVSDYGKSLNDVADAVRDGRLALGKGDVLTVSQGNKEHTFEQLAKDLGLSTPPGELKENLKTLRPQLLERMRQVAEDQSASPELRHRMRVAYGASQALDRLSGMGIEVVHAAGNDGKDILNIDFLNAQTQLAATDQAGNVLPFSADHPLTKREIGLYDLKYERTSPGDQKPVEEQVGRYKLGHLPIYFPASHFGGVHTNNRFYELGPDGEKQEVPPKTSNPHANQAVDIISGTSFSNINYLWKNYERLRALKTSG